MAGPHKAISPELMRERRIEQQIQQVYKDAPVVTKGTSRGKPVTRYYEPTPEQQKKIVELASQLPKEKAEKYVTYEEVPQQPKGIAETLMGTIIDVRTKIPKETITSLTGESEVPRWFPIAPAYGFAAPVGAGAVASVESLVYGGERLVSHFITHHEPITPRPPPTQTGGIIGAALGDPSELEKVQEYGGFYAAGTVAGDILLAYGIGKAVEKPTTKLIQWAAKTKAGQYVSSKIPSKLKNLFYKTELEVQRRYDPHAQYALKQARYRPHYGLKSDLGKFIQSTEVKGGLVHTPYASTLEKTIKVPTKTGQILLQKSTQEATKQLPTLTLTKTVSPVIKAVAPKIVTEISKITLKELVSPFVWAGTKFPSILKTDIWTETSVKVKPYPIISSTEKAELEKLSKTIPKSIVETSIIPSQIPVVDVSPIQEVQQVQRQELKQMQAQSQMLVKQQIQVPKFYKDDFLKLRRRKKGTKPSDLFGREKRAYPILGAKQTLKKLIGI